MTTTKLNLAKEYMSYYTAKQMQDFIKDKLKEKGMLGFVAKFFSTGIPKFKRWQG